MFYCTPFLLVVQLLLAEAFSPNYPTFSLLRSHHSVGTLLMSTTNNEKPKTKKVKRKKLKTKNNPGVLETWRLYGVSIHPDALETAESSQLKTEFPDALKHSMREKLKCKEEENLPPIKVVRRSLDARKKLRHPTFNYVVDVTITRQQAHSLGWRHQPGRCERMDEKKEDSKEGNENSSSGSPTKTVVVVGTGPAGLFCALQLALKGVKPILLDRGQPVEKRGRDIGALMHRRSLDMESNFAFGEGGAGTWSDGKLTTRIGRNSDSVRYILEMFVEYGAPSNILWEGSPHLGTDNLVRILRNMRHHLIELGGEIHFGTKMTDLIMEDSNIIGVSVLDQDSEKRDILADATVLATGHSARDVYEALHKSGVQLEAKGFAVGFRIEHPQTLINEIQYGKVWGPSVQTGKSKTDTANLEYFGGGAPKHGKLPVPSYRLATDKANDGSGNCRGVYSFCMCPGGQIVPSSTDPDEVCVNGMSFSRRDSLWANSALVVTVSPEDVILEPYKNEHGVLAGLAFQRDMEHRASVMGGGNFTVPVQRVTDFCHGKVSATLPTSSYRLGVKSAPCHEIYPQAITEALRDALANHFSNQMPGYFHDDGLLHAVETRTSSPLRIARHPETLEAIGSDNLFPAGEGAGFAGGIVSAAVDGMVVSEAVLDKLFGTSRPGRAEKSKSVGFNY